MPYRSRELHVLIVRGVGWRARCSCSWRGPFRRDRPDARADMADHLAVSERD